MKIIHVLADGTQKTDISGHVVKKKDTEALYEIFTRIKRRLQNEKSDKRT
jgi:hypothetical protein